ncbi:hypothetical protein IB265_33465 [Ensifer sp. ENS10]|uniref:hypothetical protein n=1 Tax=Ensifer sp. ENS10 TaxID=2769286 RepID=UPI00178333E8|nr:hypothetical protein [Ensifer sp. ENS10]MBD9511667.1 hypothetical protein [Ensifer sp. ENS10]
MMWDPGKKILAPQMAVKIVSAPEKPKTLYERFKDWFTEGDSAYLKRQAEIRAKEEEKAKLAAAAAPPPALGWWDGKAFTNTMVFEDARTATWMARDRRVPWSPSGLILHQYDAEEWNDMEESEREDAILEWQKINHLSTLGIKAPEMDLQEAHVRRMEKKAKADQLARDMLDHKRKLEEQLKEAEEREKLYEGNATYGAF